jgi:hypothetical protein
MTGRFSVGAPSKIPAIVLNVNVIRPHKDLVQAPDYAAPGLPSPGRDTERAVSVSNRRTGSTIGHLTLPAVWEPCTE